MARKPLPSQEVLRQLLDYDPETGILRWKARGREWFKTKRSCSVWNARFANQLALNAPNDKGYLCGALCGKRVASHRVIWKIVTGDEADFIDHINGDKSDNRLVNLRSVSKAENQRNRRLPSNSTSGVMGVSYRHDTSQWLAYIGFEGKLHRLGQFATMNEAVIARKAAEMRFGFHQNHGRAD